MRWSAKTAGDECRTSADNLHKRGPNSAVIAADPALEHDPEKCEAVFPRDKRVAFARRSCSNNNLKRDDDSSQSHRALAVRPLALRPFRQLVLGVVPGRGVGSPDMYLRPRRDRGVQTSHSQQD